MSAHLSRYNQYDVIRSAGVKRVSEALGLRVIEANGRSTIAPCPACKRDRRSETHRRDRRGPIGIANSNRGWQCHCCKVKGDAVTLAALITVGEVPPRGDPRWRERVLRACLDAGIVR